MEKEKTTIFDKIWDFFASVRLTIVVFIALASTSIIGTIVEQRAEPATNIKLLAKFFGDSTAPTVYNIFVKLGFMDMYHSWWFVSLLILFSVNLIICSIERLPKTWRLVKMPLRPLNENVIKTLPVKKEMSIKTSLNTAKDEVLKSLSSYRYHVLAESAEENAVQLYSQKGGYTRLGLYVVHLSIILIFIGAIIGARFGFNGYLNLPEGMSASYAFLRTEPLSQAEQAEREQMLDIMESSQGDVSLTAKNLGITQDILDAKFKKYGIKPLGFTIICNWFNTEYYSQTDMPQEFQSELVIIENDREVLKKVIEVNHPLTYKGITFYQSSYGMVPNAVGTFVLKVRSTTGAEETLNLKFGQSFMIPGTNTRGTIVDFSPALARDPNTGKLITYSENMVNPAVGIEFDSPNAGRFTGWILKRYPETGVLPDGSQIKFLDYWGVEYTGLQVSRDPGVWFIYVASVIMAIGLYVAFFMSHKKLWIILRPETSGEKVSVRITVGGSASKNRLAFEREIERILSKASRTIEGLRPVGRE
ncbi:MAG: cytochrome c biogenesis protein ResB [Thermodesulfovibrionia bacterium]|nr:cytochrome c biogenesis protein ResB [Thermodesulfovibrionia bacterium]